MLIMYHYKIVFGLLGGVLLISSAYQYFATKIDSFRYPAPGKRVDVGGYKLHCYSEGKGSPTIILDSGFGGDSNWWYFIQKEVAQHAQVISYDRAGYGWSDTSPHGRMRKAVIQELHALLCALGAQPHLIFLLVIQWVDL